MVTPTKVKTVVFEMEKILVLLLIIVISENIFTANGISESEEQLLILMKHKAVKDAKHLSESMSKYAKIVNKYFKDKFKQVF